MNKNTVYKNLESQMVRYTDLKRVDVKDNGEKMERISETTALSTCPIDPNMQIYTGKEIFVRSSVLDRLKTASQLIKELNKNYKLQIVYGYRALEIQQNLFEQFKSDLSNQYTGIELLEAIHRNIAIPDVSGHPTGGAVDVQVIQDTKPIDFGTNIWEFTKDSYTFSPFISKIAQTNRFILRNCMIKAGFAPFDGEWWHYSYGDKEWAFYYKQTTALYEQIAFSVF